RGVLALPSAGRESWWMRHLRVAGLCSYSLYLVHQPVINAVASVLAHRLKEVPEVSWILFAVCVGLWFPAVVACSLLYRLIEGASVEIGEYLIRKFGVRRKMGASLFPKG